MLDQVDLGRVVQLAPPLGDKFREMDAECSAAGIEIRLTQGLRDVALQDTYWTYGRTVMSPTGCRHIGDAVPRKPGTCPVHPLGATITNARGLDSYHCLGLAFDAAPSLYAPGMTYDPDWNESHPTWKQMQQIGQKLGLNCGCMWPTFKDGPHFQLTGAYDWKKPPQELRDAYKSGGLHVVWKLVFPGVQI